MWNDLWTIPLTSLGALLILFLLCKLMGNKQISQLSMFDYIIGISIGSIAAEMATELEAPWRPALAMVVFGLFALLISVLTSKWLWLRRAMTGQPILLMDGGVILRENMKKARFDLSDFLTLCRIQGYFDVSDIQTAIMEENGTVSFLPKADARPLQPRDAAVFPPQEYIRHNVVLDGVALPHTLAALGRDEKWLIEQLHMLGYHRFCDVYLATLAADGTVQAFPMRGATLPFHPFD